MKKADLKVGDVYAIPLEKGVFGFAVIAEGKDCAVSQLTTKEPFPNAGEVMEAPSAFRVPVFQDIAKNGKWKLLGNVKLSGLLSVRNFYWTQAVGDNKLYKFQTIDKQVETSLEDVARLERMAWYDDSFLKQRLEDYIAGRVNAVASRLNSVKYYDPATKQEVKKGSTPT